MRKKLSPARAPLPKFQSDQEAAEYFESHSAAGVWDQLPTARQAKPLPTLASKIRDRHARAKSPISLRLAPEQIAAAKHIAAAKSVGTRRNCACGLPRVSAAKRSAPKCPRAGHARPLLARRRDDAVHAGVDYHLAVMVERVPDGDVRDSGTRLVGAAERRF